ncbi:MAG: hypothetical protein LBU55_00165 [Elusimicrobiota bacterium]|nr:hypothetical protein [Elusimicrobiota bacterium]
MTTSLALIVHSIVFGIVFALLFLVFHKILRIIKINLASLFFFGTILFFVLSILLRKYVDL